MKVYIPWIIIFGYLLNRCVRGQKTDTDTDFEVFKSAPEGQQQRSQSISPEPSFNPEEFFKDDYGTKRLHKRYTKTKVNLGNLKPVAAEPEITQSVFYVSPEDIERRVSRRSPQNDENSQSNYEDGYKEFLAKYFSEPDEEPQKPEPKSAQLSISGPTRGISRYRTGPSSRIKSDVEDIPRQRKVSSSRDDSDEEERDVEYERIKLLSQKQEAEIKQNPKHCKVSVKGNMRCSVCKNPESGAHSESCSFSSTAEPKKYAYTKERNYNSKDDEEGEDDGEEEDEDGEEEETKKEASQKNESKNAQIIVTTSTTTTSRPLILPTRRNLRLRARTTVPTPVFEAPTRGPVLRRSQPLRNPRNNTNRFSATYQAAEESRQVRQVVGLDPFLYGGGDDDGKSNKSEEYKRGSYDEYFSHIFPNSKNKRFQELKVEKETRDDDVEFLPNYDTKQNVEKVLAAFKKKDWSSCKKQLKGDLTCYQCKDERGVRHEECIYISHPKTSRLTYSEVKQFEDPDDEDGNEDAENHSSDVVTDKSIVPDKQHSKRKFKRKLVVRKRKAKVPKSERLESTTAKSLLSDDELLPHPEDVTDHHESGAGGNEKSTIKRTISYRIENNNEEVPAESRVVVYEHRVSKTI